MSKKSKGKAEKNKREKILKNWENKINQNFQKSKISKKIKINQDKDPGFTTNN